MLTRVLLHRGVCSADLDDALQEVVVAAWRAIREGRYRPDPRADASRLLRAWLCGIAWRQASHWLDRAWRRREVPLPSPREVVAPHDELASDALDLLLWREVGARFFEACLALRPELQEPLLALLRGRSVEEVARATGVKENTVRNRLRLARAAMKQQVDRAELAERWSERRRT